MGSASASASRPDDDHADSDPALYAVWVGEDGGAHALDARDLLLVSLKLGAPHSVAAQQPFAAFLLDPIAFLEAQAAAHAGHPRIHPALAELREQAELGIERDELLDVDARVGLGRAPRVVDTTGVRGHALSERAPG